MGYRFSLVLSREITDDESKILQKAARAEAIFGTDTLPTNAEVSVTKMDFDDTVSDTLAEAIEVALESVKNVPDLSVPGLEVPAQPATYEDPGNPRVVQSVVVDEEKQDIPEANGTAKKKPSARKTSTKSAAKKAAAAEAEKSTADSASVDS